MGLIDEACSPLDLVIHEELKWPDQETKALVCSSLCDYVAGAGGAGDGRPSTGGCN